MDNLEPFRAFWREYGRVSRNCGDTIRGALPILSVNDVHITIDDFRRAFDADPIDTPDMCVGKRVQWLGYQLEAPPIPQGEIVAFAPPDGFSILWDDGISAWHGIWQFRRGLVRFLD